MLVVSFLTSVVVDIFEIINSFFTSVVVVVVVVAAAAAAAAAAVDDVFDVDFLLQQRFNPRFHSLRSGVYDWHEVDR